jgi:hypothetical protein
MESKSEIQATGKKKLSITLLSNHVVINPGLTNIIIDIYKKEPEEIAQESKKQKGSFSSNPFTETREAIKTKTQHLENEEYEISLTSTGEYDAISNIKDQDIIILALPLSNCSFDQNASSKTTIAMHNTQWGNLLDAPDAKKPEQSVFGALIEQNPNAKWITNLIGRLKDDVTPDDIKNMMDSKFTALKDLKNKYKSSKEADIQTLDDVKKHLSTVTDTILAIDPPVIKQAELGKMNDKNVKTTKDTLKEEINRLSNKSQRKEETLETTPANAASPLSHVQRYYQTPPGSPKRKGQDPNL